MDGDQPLFGRDDALGEVRHAVDRAGSGVGSFVVVTGEAGIGKTRLVEAATAGRPTFWARATEGGPKSGLWLWSQVFRLARRAGRDVEADLSGDGPQQPFGVGEGGHERHLRLARALDELHRLADGGFCVVVLDDLQWADADSLLLLEMLDAEVTTLPLAVLATVRSEAILTVPRARATIALDGLSSEAIGSIVASIAGTSPGSAVVDAARDLTGGNPLFVTEVARLLHGSGTVLDAPAWQGVLPAGVHAVLARRLARLPADSLDVVSAAAVLGFEVDATVLASVTEIDRLDVYERLQPVVDAGLMNDLGDGRFRFGHVLVQESALAGVALRRRQRLHAAAATTLETLEGERAAGVIASHLQAAGERLQARQWSRLAGDRALADGMHEDAVRWYVLAGELGDDDPELRLRHAEALSRTGAADEARSMFVQVASTARDAGDSALFGRAALGVGTIGGGFEIRLLDVSQIALLREALDRVGPDSSSIRVRLMARLSVAGTLTTDHDERVALADAAVEGARDLDDDRSLVGAMAAWCDAHASAGHIDERLVVSDEMVGAATRSGDPELELLARRYRIVALMESGNVAVAAGEVRAFARLADDLRQPGFRWYARVVEGMLAFLHGDLDGAWALAERAVVDGRAAGSANAEMLAVGSLQGMIRRERRDLAGYLQALTAANADHHEANRGMEFIYPIFLVGYGIDRDTVRDILGRLPRELDWASRDGLHLYVWASLGDAAAFVGDREWADRALAELVPHAERFVLDGTASVCYGPVAAFLGRIAAAFGRSDEAADWFHLALAGLADIRAPLLRRRIESDLAALVDETGAERSGRKNGPAGSNGNDPAPRFAHDGDTWTVRFAGGAIHLRDAKGLRDLRELLARPHQQIHVLDLVDAAEGHRSDDRSVNNDLGDVIDARARRAYEDRIRDLTERIEDAEEHNDIAMAATLDDERAQLLEHLGAALGLSGRRRPQGSDAERARKAVRMRIRDAIARIERQLPPLGAHLHNSVHTGVFCSYRPEQPVTWQLD